MGNEQSSKQEPDFRVLSIEIKKSNDGIIRRTTEFKDGRLEEYCNINIIHLSTGDWVRSKCKSCNERLGICKKDPAEIAKQLFIERDEHIILPNEVKLVNNKRIIKHDNKIFIENCITGDLEMNNNNNNNKSIIVPKLRLSELNLEACKTDPTKIFNSFIYEHVRLDNYF